MGLCEPLLVSALVTYIYVVFVYCNLVPQVELLRFSKDPEPLGTVDPHAHHAPLSEIVGVAVSFHILFFLFLLCFVRSVLTPPGAIPRNGQWSDTKYFNSRITRGEEDQVKRLIQSNDSETLETEPIKAFLRSLIVVERKSDGNLRYCKEDRLYKPDRCHHCSVCQECVLRMDHHCPWISNCVGYGNYKFFMLLLFYGMLCCGFILGAMLPRLINVFQSIKSNSDFLQYDLPIGIAYLATALTFIAMSVFFFFHIWLTLHAMTTIEWKEKFNHEDADVRRRFQVAHVKFDKGKYNNFVDVFGPAYMWLLPIESDSQPDGTYSDVFCATWSERE